MKKRSLIAAMLLTASIMQADEQAIKQEGIKYIGMLGSELKANLVAKMKADPTGVEAMGFCVGAAMPITKEINAKLPSYASVRRTALGYRNDANKPDALDTEVMNGYVQKVKDKTFKPEDIVMVKDGEGYRVYKPLLTEAACLKCHGAAISEALTKTTASVYPNDTAKDFLEGDFRGVIVSHIKK